MPSFAGLRGTGQMGATERGEDFRKFILWANPNGTAPITALLGKAAKQRTIDPHFHWYEEKLGAVRLQINKIGRAHV